MVTWSRCASPSEADTPGTLRRVSLIDSAPWSWITARGTTFTDCGISRNGTGIFVAVFAMGVS